MAYLHGWPKLISFTESMDGFPDYIGLGSPISLGLVVFAEFFCAIALALGIATRAVTVPLIITMAVAAFFYHATDPMSDRESSLIYLACFVTILLAGSGKYSLNRISFR